MDESAVLAALFTRLRAATALTTAIGDSTGLKGIYRHGYQPRTPSLPCVTLEFIGGPTRRPGAWEDCSCLVTVRAYHGDTEAVQSAVEVALSSHITPVSVTGADIVSCQRISRGMDMWDDDLKVHFRPDQYVVRYRLYAAVRGGS
jgi:hypothetical protein